MFFELKISKYSKHLFCLLLLTTLYVPGQYSIHARTFKADLSVCVKNSEGKAIENASIVLKGGSKDVLIKAAPESGCYTNTGITFDDSRAYSLQIRAEAYEPRDEPVDTSTAASTGLLNSGPVTLKALTSSNVTSPLPLSASPSPPTDEIKVGRSDWTKIALIAFLIDIALILLGSLVLLLRKGRQPSATSLRSSDSPDGQLALTMKDMSANLKTNLEKLSSHLNGIEGHQKDQVDILLKILDRLPLRFSGSQTTVEPLKDGLENESSVTDRVDRAAPPLSDKEKSRELYETFLRGESVTSDSIKLSDVGGSAAEDLLGPRRTMLEENPSGAIILFPNPNGDGGGWAYPNTAIFYKPEALQSLFPHVSAEQFESLKTNKSLDGSNLEPVPAKRIVETGQWQVEMGREQM